jgi:hypothetical protein
VIPACLVPTTVAVIVYELVGFVLSTRMMRHGKDGIPWGFAAFRKESYTPEGQRLLALLRKGWGPVRGSVVVFLLFLGSVVVCRLTGWRPSP